MKYLIAIFLISSVLCSKADSPLTSTNFSKAYKSEKMIVYTKENGLNQKLLKFLGKEQKESVIKIAIINELGWGDKDLVKQFEAYLLDKRKGLKPEVFDYLREFTEEIPVENEQTNRLTADDLMCWAYLQALGDYFTPKLASKAAYFSFVREPNSMAHASVFALVACQVSFDTDWCYVYQIGQEFLVAKTYDKNKLSQEALKIILDYFNLYAADCN
ncbi:hypothetical protein OAV92_02525 [Crocinitomicaceae bacterium]|nr:hypothetical protein [Crocinitomicaceae bacterium]